MRRRLLVRLLFCLGLLLGQAAALAHATQHELSPDGAAACQLCAVAHGAGGTPAPVYVAGDAPGPSAALPASPRAAFAQQARSRPHATGPPLLLA